VPLVADSPVAGPLGAKPRQRTGPALTGQLVIEHLAKHLGSVGGDHRLLNHLLLDLIEFQGPCSLTAWASAASRSRRKLLAIRFAHKAVIPEGRRCNVLT
jgi:hypothetical protein